MKNQNLPAEIDNVLDMMYSADDTAACEPHAKPGRTYTRDDIVRILNDSVKKTAKQWGEDYIYTRWERDYANAQIAKYDAGDVIEVEHERYIENSNEYEDLYMSDGTVKTICFGYID